MPAAVKSTSAAAKPSKASGAPDKPKNAADKFLEAAMKFKGIPYLWGGGHAPKTFDKPGRVDCSGLVMQAARMAGINLNLDGTAAVQQDKGKAVSLNDLKPGDLLFKNDPATHVGIYIGNGQFLHAPKTGDVVKVQSMSSYNWSGARRVFDEAGEPIDGGAAPDAAPGSFDSSGGSPSSGGAPSSGGSPGGSSGGDGANLSSGGGSPSRMGLPGGSSGGQSGGAPRAASGRSGGSPASGSTSYSGATTPAFDWDKLLSEFLADGVPQTEAEEMIAALKAGNRAKALGKLQGKGLSADKVAKLTKAIEKAPAMGNAHAERDNWFISQYGSKSNTNEDVPGLDNGNCGPTSLTMIAKAFGKITPDAAGADAAIEESRRRIGDGMNERNGTSVAGIAKGAQSYGLDAKVRWDANLETIQSELAQGRLVVAHLGTYHLSGNRGGGHYTVVTGIADGKVYLNDPANKSGPMVVDAAKFMESVRDRGTYGMVSIGP